MQSAQESLAELRAAIRYCENAISAAEGTIESIDFRQQLAKQQAMNKQESTGREEALTKRVQELESKVQGQYDDIKNLEYDLTAKTAQASAWKKEADELRHKFCEKFEPTMPVIPRDVAIAIFREGIRQGVDDACNELRGQTIDIRECGSVGDFEVSFSREIDLDDELDLDWVRDKVGSYDTESVEANLKGLCKNLNFECRIHGIDDND